MTRIRIANAISLDGYTAGPEQGPDAPLGRGGQRLHQWMFATNAMGPASAGEEPPADASDEVRLVYEHFENVGAYILGRNMFGGGPGPWPSDPQWDGWWGEEPPYHTPVFVLTHYPREPLVMEGGTVFHFVTGGPQEALERAREAAGDRDIRIGGGAATVSQYLQLGVVDELLLHVAPVLLGAGERPFDGVDPEALGFTIDRVITGELATHIRYRVAPAR